MELAITRREELYHRYQPSVETDGDPLTTLLLGWTRCNQHVVRVVNENTRPSPISAHADVREALQSGLYCGNCWPQPLTLPAAQARGGA